MGHLRRLYKAGNSIVCPIPGDVLDALGVWAGDQLDFQGVVDLRLIVTGRARIQGDLNFLEGRKVGVMGDGAPSDAASGGGSAMPPGAVSAEDVGRPGDALDRPHADGHEPTEVASAPPDPERRSENID